MYPEYRRAGFYKCITQDIKTISTLDKFKTLLKWYRTARPYYSIDKFIDDNPGLSDGFT